jgi:hypothetical protein
MVTDDQYAVFAGAKKLPHASEAVRNISKPFRLHALEERA